MTDRPTPTMRVAQPADAVRIRTLMRVSVAGLFPESYDARQTASALQFVAEPDPSLLGDGTYFVLEVGDELVGCGGWSRRKRPYMGSAPSPDDDALLDPRTDAAHVRAMFVRPDWTRRGLGRRILEACEIAALKDGFRRLELVATLPGVPLYRACGFVPVGQVEDVVLTDGARLPCLAMAKAIG